jgi:hypothetical protein
MRWRWLGGAVLALAAANGVGARELGVQVAADTALHSDYVFRGTRICGTAWQTGVVVQDKVSRRLGLNAALRSIVNLGAGEPGLGENDFTLGLRYRPLPRLTLAGGWTYYQQNKAVFYSADTSELYGAVSGNLPGRPKLEAWYDVGNYPGLYARLSAGESLPAPLIGRRWSVELEGALGWQLGRRSEGAPDGFNDMKLHTGLAYNLGHGLRVEPAVDWWAANPAANPREARIVLSATLSYAKKF